MLTPTVLVQATLLVLGCVWCGQMLRRWRTDLRDFRAAPDVSERIGIAIPWLVTAVVGSLVVGFVGRIVERIVA